jgi:hypothetical protein
MTAIKWKKGATRHIFEALMGRGWVAYETLVEVCFKHQTIKEGQHPRRCYPVEVASALKALREKPGVNAVFEESQDKILSNRKKTYPKMVRLVDCDQWRDEREQASALAEASQPEPVPEAPEPKKFDGDVVEVILELNLDRIANMLEYMSPEALAKLFNMLAERGVLEKVKM